MNETIVWAWQALPIDAESPTLAFHVWKVWNHPWWLSPVLFCTEQHTVSNQYFFCSLRFLIHTLRKLHILYSLRYTLQNLRYTQECTLKTPCLHPICLSLSPRMTEWGLLYSSNFCVQALSSLFWFSCWSSGGRFYLQQALQCMPDSPAWLLPAPLFKNCISDLISGTLNYA